MVNSNIVDAVTKYSSSGAGYDSLDIIFSIGETILMTLLGLGVVFLIIALIIAIFSIIANWALFKKAGEKGWKSIIPIYGTITLFKIAGVSPWLILGYLLVFIPYIGGLISVGITIYVMINLAKAFGKGDGFTVGLILLNFIFMLILAFGNSEYQLNKETPEIIDNNEQL